MSKAQLITISIAIALLATLYFGGRKHPNSQKEIEATRIEDAQKASISDLVARAKMSLNETDQNQLAALENQLSLAGKDTARLKAFKNLSGFWYQKSNFAVSAFYAEEVAQIDDSDSAWSIAGLSYAMCFTQAEDERVFNFCYDKAIGAFENAASIAPDSTVHKENLAYCYTQNPNPTQVMKGVQIYQGILDQNPENLKVLLRLGKLSVDMTGDYTKALPRLEQAVKVAPDNFDANFYLAQAYQGLGRPTEAKEYYNNALQLTSDAALQSEIQKILTNL